MHEARIGTDEFGEVGEEGDDVVLDLALDLVDPRDVELGVLALGLDGLGGLLRDDAEFGLGIRGMGLDFEPDAKASVWRPDRHHLGSGIAWNHGSVSALGLLMVWA